MLLHLATATSFGIGIFALLHARRSGSPAHRLLAGVASCIAFVLVVSTPLFAQDWQALSSAAIASFLFGGTIYLAHLLYPDGVDRFDIGFCAFVTFIVGAGGWRVASQTLIFAAVISGLIGMATLIASRRDNPSVPFEFVLAAVAVGTMFMR